MIKRQRTTVVLAAMAVFGWSVAPARAQNVGNPGAPPGEPPKPPSEGGPPSTDQAPPTPPAPPSDATPPPPGAAPDQLPSGTLPTPAGADQGEFPSTVFGAPAQPRKTRKKRTRDLETTVGMQPPDPDFGSEADLVSTADEDAPPARPKKWVYSLKGFLRAPMRVGIGPRQDGSPGDQLHSPPRIPGLDSDDWNYVGLAPSPTAQLHLNVSNANVSGNLIIAASTLFDSGYKDLDQIGGVSQAYVTVTSPELFGKRGGIAWTVGSFSNRYGVAGPRQNSSGYYGTYLFGRTHVAGEALTVDVDLTDDLKLVVEHGIGAKLEVVPFIQLNHNPPPPRTPYVPDQGPVAQGSNFVHHAHAALVVNDWLRVAGHYMSSWTPNDNDLDLTHTDRPEGRMTVLGGEVHVDSPTVGNAYVGYSHIDAKKILPLADGIQVLHGSTGFSFKQNYFGALPTVTVPGGNGGPLLGPGPEHDDSGTVDTVLGQYVLKLSQVLGLGPQGPDAALAVYGMLNHVKAFKTSAGKDVTVDKYKFGAELEVTPIRLLSVGVRFDRAAPDGHNADLTYSALSPRVVFHTNWLSREYVILNYTHYFLGSSVVPFAYYPYDQLVYTKTDENLITLSAIVSF
jgi:hypothetical protein